MVCIDAREENIITLRSRYRTMVAHVANIETDPLIQFGIFEIVFCYGLLYHLENIISGMRNIASVCADLLILETMVTDHSEPLARLADEPNLTPNQSVGHFGMRPSPAFITMVLNRLGFAFIYAPRVPPDHPDFCFEWTNRLDCSRNGYLLRCVFVASRRELSSPALSLLLADRNAAVREPGFKAVVSQPATLPRTPMPENLLELTGVIHDIQAAGAQAEIHRGTPTRIITPEGRWSYAAAIPLTIPEDAAGEIWVRIRATILRGEAGFGLLNRAGTAFQDRHFASAGEEVQTIYLQIANSADLQSLIIENSTPDGSRAEILLEEVKVLAARADHTA